MGKRLPKSALLEEIRVERRALDALLEQLKQRQMTEPNVTPGGWSVKDILAHLVGWQQMNLSWYEAGLRGEKPAVPAPGLTWREVPKLNAMIYRRRHRQSLRAVLADYRNYHEQMLKLIDTASDEDFLQVGRFAWAGPTWTLSDYVRANTASHYRWARNHIRKWMRAQQRER
jgi:hypothetical protein